ncbi:MAG: hypothetical protein DRR42_24020 [Gammaproteobacteria bacterium]|nr:MAG: hypothetical protein DRR42_24020 [Gammaproteobacteria bacterium]
MKANGVYLKFCILLVGFSVLFGCKTSERDLLSPDYNLPEDPIHAQLSEGLNMPTNLGGGFFSFVKPSVYLVVHENNTFKAYDTDPSGELFNIDIAEIKGDDIVICYVDQQYSWAVLHEIRTLLGNESSRIFVAYNQWWKNNSHRELVEVEYDDDSSSRCHVIKVKMFADGRIMQTGAYGDFQCDSIYKARVYRSRQQESCCDRPVCLIADPEITIQDYLINLGILKSMAETGVFVGQTGQSFDFCVEGNLTTNTAPPRGAEGGCGSEESNP